MAERARPKSLTQLAKDLHTALQTGVVTQTGIAAALGISESTISKAKHDKLRQETADTRALHSYLSQVLDRRELPITVTDAAFGYFAAGGREAELVDIIVLATRLVRSR